ncbi:hypothetical protein [Saccharopolyspora phatthalungensis]|uniref:Uncharacterized protein n=1 Tax=Saccharopolyspora phatthalungensis TaxID=664693 RepID=A0A840QJ84_9PSEU|nr:hypothetical protein [Saccharopolyspora phatthalungensis]MBB5158865.1 hypothetical protein [Saccharopolyspora phatthalungensis]
MTTFAKATPKVVATGLDRPYGLVIDSKANVAYVCTQDSLTKVSLKDGTKTPVVGSGMGDIHTIALYDQTTAFTPDDTPNTGALYKVDLSKGTKVSIGPTMQEPLGVALNSAKDTIYVLTWRSNTLYALKTNGDLIHQYSLPAGKYHSVTVGDDGYAYVVRDYTTITRVKLTDGTYSDLATGFNKLFDFALDNAGSLYAPDADTGVLWHVDLKTGDKEQVAAGLGRTHGMASDGSQNAYVTNEDEGELLFVEHALKPPVKSPVITEPTNGAEVTPRQVIKGTVDDADKVVMLSGSGSELGDANLVGHDWTFTPSTDWPLGKASVQAVAHKGNDESVPAVVNFLVVDHNLKVDQALRGHWQKKAPEPPRIYSFRLTLHAKDTDVHLWTISFDAPERVIPDPDWAKTFWGKIEQKGGTIFLHNPDPKHVVLAGKELLVDIELLCPCEDSSYEKLQHLIAHQDQ